MTAGATYVPIATQTLGSAVGSVTFSSIPGTYTDLVLTVSASVSSTWDVAAIQVNSITSGYSRTYLQGDGTSATSARATAEIRLRGGYLPPSSGGTFSADTYHFMNYANTTTNKTVLVRASSVNTGSQGFNAHASVSLVPTTAAITQLIVLPINGANLAIGSTFTLYGISSA
jgi:hypothetical protein